MFPCLQAYVVSSVETLSVWDLVSGARLQSYDSIRRQPDDDDDAADADDADAPPRVTANGGGGGGTGGSGEAFGAMGVWSSTRGPPPPSAAAEYVADGVDFVVGCHWDEARGRLLLLGGEHGGGVHLLHAAADGAVARVDTLRGGVGGGHVSGVRCFDWAEPPGAVITGGEDGRICAWAVGGGGGGGGGGEGRGLGGHAAVGGKAPSKASARRGTAPY